MLTPAQIALLLKVSDHARDAKALTPSYIVQPRERRTARVLIRERFVKDDTRHYFPKAKGLFVSLYY